MFSRRLAPDVALRAKRFRYRHLDVAGMLVHTGRRLGAAAQQAGGFIHFVDLSSTFSGHELRSGGTEWFYGIDAGAGFQSGSPLASTFT